ncbi:MAG: LamG-like jellyroll fold domain-containing protein [Bacteroidia bacterium]
MKIQYKNLLSLPGLLLMAMFLNPRVATAQNQNALNFDGVDDNVSVPGASSLIAGSNAISITCWVYPTNVAPAWPDYDGIAGFRNDADADFYLAQTGLTHLEARFRNSAGTPFDINNFSLQANTWQHLALTYDGSMLRLFVNGLVTDSVAASGNITNSAVDFLIGDNLYVITHFYLEGSMDEVSLWNKALSPAEITAIYTCGADAAAANLQLYYHFNEGIAGGNNSTVTSLADETGHIDGVLNNFALNGTTSNWATGVTGVSTAINAGICDGDSYTFGSQTLTTSGVYVDSLTSVNGCDSIVTLNLTVTPIDTSVTLFTTVLHSNTNGATYTWVNCNNGYAAISGATAQNYVVTTGGSYAVIVQLNGCIDTSSCHTVTFAGINENEFSTAVHVYPNPLDKQLTVNFEKQLDVTIVITDVTGKQMLNENVKNVKTYHADVSSWTAGVYLMKINSGSRQAVFNLLKK